MSKRFRVALSFSGDKRSFVAEVARLLSDTFGEDRVLYDNYHEAEFARPDLAFHLPVLYHEQSDLIVAVLSRDYDSKEWCGLEWNAIYGLIKKRADPEAQPRFREAVATMELALALSPGNSAWEQDLARLKTWLE